MLRIDLKRENRANQWYDTAICNGLSYSKSKHSVICPLARKLIEQNLAKRDDLVEIYRGDNLVFSAVELSHWADKMIYENDKTGLITVDWDYEAAEKRAEYFASLSANE